MPPRGREDRNSARRLCSRSGSVHTRRAGSASSARPHPASLLPGRRDCPTDCPTASLRRRKPAGGAGFVSTATGIRTPVSAVRGRRPSPLDDGGSGGHSSGVWRRRLHQALSSAGSLGRLVVVRNPRTLLAMAAACAAAFCLLLALAYGSSGARWLDASALSGFIELQGRHVGRWHSGSRSSAIRSRWS
jgi:hypothetical protein